MSLRTRGKIKQTPMARPARDLLHACPPTDVFRSLLVTPDSFQRPIRERSIFPNALAQSVAFQNTLDRTLATKPVIHPLVELRGSACAAGCGRGRRRLSAGAACSAWARPVAVPVAARARARPRRRLPRSPRARPRSVVCASTFFFFFQIRSLSLRRFLSLSLSLSRDALDEARCTQRCVSGTRGVRTRRRAAVFLAKRGTCRGENENVFWDYNFAPERAVCLSLSPSLPLFLSISLSLCLSIGIERLFFLFFFFLLCDLVLFSREERAALLV